MERFKANAKVSATTTSGKSFYRSGKLVKCHKTAKGDWWEVKPDDGSKNFKTRPAYVSPL